MPAKGAAKPARERIRPKHATISGLEVAEVYGPADVRGEIGEPGRYPFTRGVYPRQDRFLFWFNEEWRTRMGRERLG